MGTVKRLAPVADGVQCGGYVDLGLRDEYGRAVGMLLEVREMMVVEIESDRFNDWSCPVAAALPTGATAWQAYAQAARHHTTGPRLGWVAYGACQRSEEFATLAAAYNYLDTREASTRKAYEKKYGKIP